MICQMKVLVEIHRDRKIGRNFSGIRALKASMLAILATEAVLS